MKPVASLSLLLLITGTLVDAHSRILLRDIQALTLTKGEYTTARRSSPIPQIKCVGGKACKSTAARDIQTIQCKNKGWDGSTVQWECKADIDDSVRFGKTIVSCEGWNGPNDAYVLVGSCGVEYTLDYTSKAREREDRDRTRHQRHDRQKIRYDRDEGFIKQIFNHAIFSPLSYFFSLFGSISTLWKIVGILWGLNLIWRIFFSRSNTRTPSAHPNTNPPPYNPNYQTGDNYGYNAYGPPPPPPRPSYSHNNFWNGFTLGGVLGGLAGRSWNTPGYYSTPYMRRQYYTQPANQDQRTNDSQRTPSPNRSSSTRTASGFGGSKVHMTDSNTKKLLATLLYVYLILTLVIAHGDLRRAPKNEPYSQGDLVTIECPILDTTGEPTESYEPGPICIDTGLPLQFPFATDAIVHCSIPTTELTFKHLQKVISGTAAWRCRIPLTKNKTLYIPFSFNVWGDVEGGQIHMMNHFNFVFHVLDGFFLGANAYAHHMVTVESNAGITIHGPVRWFVGHTYEMINKNDDEETSNAKVKAASAPKAVLIQKEHDGKPELAVPTNRKPDSQNPTPSALALPPNLKLIKHDEIPTLSKLLNAVSPALVLMYCVLSASAATGVCVLIYLGWLKPALIREYRKLK
ncbi:Store-operated calcium entry-associated regulatory factor [Nowakowskiella sp. JEL0407]|nr:Store-operated calcium entry-associated regulatory factor [Nowakowskiella sp. JEL0407]